VQYLEDEDKRKKCESMTYDENYYAAQNSQMF